MPLAPSQLDAVTKLIEAHASPGGGFSPMSGEAFRSDATAWGILALRHLSPHHALLRPAMDRLAAAQGQDGRVSIGSEHEEVFWPTALSALAWNGSQAHERCWNQCVLFLLKTTGHHRPKTPDDQAGHDPSIPGWPWIGGTHSWVEPTALAIIALKDAGRGHHDRVRQAIQMMLDRQLPRGGWNYGNTLAFGRELYPMPESTGAALTGLAGAVGQERVARSISYLASHVERLRTPVSLGWALLGLAAWDRWPSNGEVLVERCLENQARYGQYDMSALGLLLLGAMAGDPGREVSPLSSSSRNRTRAILSQ